MSARQRSRRDLGAGRGKAAGGSRTGRSRWLVVVTMLGVIALGVLLWPLLQARTTPATSGPDGLPGPLGGPNVAQDVATMVGQPAPAFTLADSEGNSYTVTPGQGRPVVLVSHMGIT